MVEFENKELNLKRLVMDKEKLQELELSLIDRPFEPHRSRIDPEKVRELAESIREIGLQEPIVVRPVNGRYEIVAGDRRFLALKLLSASKVPAIVREMDDEMLVIARAAENLQRVDLSPLEEARVYGNMRDKLGMSTVKIAKRTGKTRQTVERYLGLLELPERWQEAVDQGKIGIEAASYLLRIDDHEMMDYYFQAAVENGVTAGVARRWMEDYHKSKIGKFNPEEGGGGVVDGLQPSAPVYQTCFGCDGPVEVKGVRYVPLCSECIRDVLLAKTESKGR